jgi:hypothetical protein
VARVIRAYERVMARAIVARDPAAALARAARAPGLPRSLRAALAAVDEDGLRMAALLVARLRFERLLRGSAEAERWFEVDPAGFTAAFHDYHHAVAPRAFFPTDEAAAFRRWRRRTRR